MSASMAEVLVAHQRQDSNACLCGWSKLGHSHPEHVAEQLTTAGFVSLNKARAQALEEAAGALSRSVVRDPLGKATFENYAEWLRNRAATERSNQ